MSTNTMALLDQAELLKLAMAASAENDSGATIGYLKEATSRSDASPYSHYLLGAEYAQIKMYDRAITEMQKALQLDASLSLVRLQLGLLWLTSGVGDTATEVLTPLHDLPETDSIGLFGKGLCHLIKDEFLEATELLQAGIARNDSNPALNNDMQKIITEIENLRAQGKLQPAASSKESHNADSADNADIVEIDEQHILLSAYTSTTSH